MPAKNATLVRIAANMRIARTALVKDISDYECLEGSQMSAHQPEAMRLKWWCEQLLKQLNQPMVSCEVGENVGLLLDLGNIMEVQSKSVERRLKIQHADE